MWNGIGITPDEYGERSALLDGLLVKAGRQSGDVKRTMTLVVLCARNADELEQRASSFRTFPGMANLPLETLLERIRSFFSTTIIGSPEHAVGELRAYEEAGAREIMIQWLNLDDIDGLRLLSEQVLPACQ